MSKRSYQQHCAVARALDVIGERWTLLVVRELLTGPKRFKDLLGGLPGIGTNLLAARLKDLEGHGLLRRATLPPPAGSRVYELTEAGRSLEPIVVGLCRWGCRFFLDAPRPEDELKPAWAMVAVRAALDPGTANEIQETYEFRVDDEAFHVRVEGGEIEARQGPAVSPDLVVRGATRAFLNLAAGRLGPAEAVESGVIKFEGDRDALARCLKMFGGPPLKEKEKR
jgi:DNA-binding HxlR family transcriptional regulator/putative sterol carrier protein